MGLFQLGHEILHLRVHFAVRKWNIVIQLYTDRHRSKDEIVEPEGIGVVGAESDQKQARAVPKAV